MNIILALVGLAAGYVFLAVLTFFGVLLLAGEFTPATIIESAQVAVTWPQIWGVAVVFAISSS